ncbi:MAG: hypothetical protein LCH79_08075 [Proteobacteria bacterium]|nr:hypothetical protein [Pseudomonadota bacterium]
MKNWADLSTNLLPKLLQDFVRLIGLQATMLLVERFGGLRIYIPLHPTPEHHFAQLIGFDNLVKLAGEFGRETHFELPKAQQALLAVRNAKMRSEYGPKSLRVLAAEYKLTERQVTRIVGADIPNDVQPALFE